MPTYESHLAQQGREFSAALREAQQRDAEAERLRTINAQLVAALEAAAAYLAAVPPSTSQGSKVEAAWAETLEQARAALAVAKGEP